MANHQNGDVKGFAGLESLASPTPEIGPKDQGYEGIANTLHSEEPHRQTEEAQPRTDSESCPRQQKKLFASITGWFDAKPIRWLLLIGIAFVVFAALPTKQNPSAQRAAIPTVTEPSAPSYGSNNVFSDREIRYCLEEEIRLSAWQAAVNTGSQTAINAFNRAVDDYNARCSSYRYRRGALERVRSDVESRRFSLEQEGRSRAYANP